VLQPASWNFARKSQAFQIKVEKSIRNLSTFSLYPDFSLLNLIYSIAFKVKRFAFFGFLKIALAEKMIKARDFERPVDFLQKAMKALIFGPFDQAKGRKKK